MRFAVCRPEEKEPPTGKKVAIIGAGPAGLKAAGFLACKGHEVVVYDRLPEPGGLLIFGIPEWRLPKKPIRKGIEELRNLGVKFITNVEVGKDIPIDELISEYDAILIATGAWRERKLGIEGEDLEGVYSALEFLVKLALVKEGYLRPEEGPKVGRKAIVIGGGNSAIDAAITLVRMGAETTIVYRRTKEYMPAHKHAVEMAEKEGVKFVFLATPKRIIGDSGRVTGVEFIRTKLTEPDASGRPRPVEIPGSEFILECDTLILAVGELPSPPAGLEKFNVKIDKKGRIIVDESGRADEKVFAAGDVATGPSSIGEAIKSGLKAAESIHKFLTS